MLLLDMDRDTLQVVYCSMTVSKGFVITVYHQQYNMRFKMADRLREGMRRDLNQSRNTRIPRVALVCDKKKMAYFSNFLLVLSSHGPIESPESDAVDIPALL
jgi:hypothetical protein